MEVILLLKVSETAEALENKSYGKWLRELGSLSLEKRRLKRDPNSLLGGCSQVGVNLFCQVTGN